MNTVMVIGFAAAYYLVTFRMLRGTVCTTRAVCISGIVVAMTLVLDSIRIPLPTGATVSLCSPVPLMLMAIVVDHRLAVMAGWVCGLLAMVLNPLWQPVHWGQVFVEHMVCFSCLGYTGVFGTQKRSQIVGGMVVASCLKIMGHLLSGVLFFSQNAWDGWGAWGYSLLYNLSQNVPLCIASGLVVLLLPLKTIRAAAERR